MICFERNDGSIFCDRKSEKIGLPEKVTCAIILNYSDLLHKSIKICEECTERKYYTEVPEEMEVQ